ncbi:MAG: hypothetical protein NTX65_03350 [Ignavibacteriales bacterium]|nr:hypothetical protein [Ignavibacteriales bacterium]
MAKVISRVLGKFSGSLGDMSLRNRKGVNYIAMKPGSFNAPTDEYSISRRLRFALTVKFSSVIYSDLLLRSIWESVAPSNMSVTNYITQNNYKMTDQNGLTALNLIVPFGGFPLTTKSFSIAEGIVSVVTNPLNNATRFDPAIEKGINLSCIITLSSPSVESLPKTLFVPCEFPAVDLDLEQEITFIHDLTKLESEMLEKYSVRKTYLAMVTKDQSDQVIHYSQTVAI